MPHDHRDSERPLDAQLPAAPIHGSAAPRSPRREKGTDFLLTGFHQVHGIRYYVYRGQHEDGNSTEIIVDADVTLLRKYGIALQELPLLCRRLLERQAPDASRKAVTFTDDLMKEQADGRAALLRAAQEKRASRRVRAAHGERDHR